MPTAIVTGSGGLVGSDSVRHFVRAGHRVIGIENDMRARFFGACSRRTPPRGDVREHVHEQGVRRPARAGYGRYFEMPTVCFRGGCLAGPSHAGARLHGFLSYLMRCAMTGTPYTLQGYAGKQVRDNLHSADLVAAVWA